MKLLLLVLPIFGLINAQYSKFYDNLAKYKQDFYARACIQYEETPECRNLNTKAQKAIKNNCFNFFKNMGYENTEDCMEQLTHVFKYNLQIQTQSNPQTGRRHENSIKRPKNTNLEVIDYDDYNAALNIASDKKQTEFESDEIVSSEEGNYDDDFWKKKDSRETLLKDINSVEKEVGIERTVESFKMPKSNALKEQYGHIAGELIEKYKSWLKTINPRVYSSNGELNFHGPRISYYGNVALLKLRPQPNGPGQVVFSSGNQIHVNFLQGKTSCGFVGTDRKQFVCIKPLDIHIRVRPETDYGKYDWDLVCMQLYLPSWKYGYEFCYNTNKANELYVYDREENEYFRKIKLFVFNGGTYDNWEPKFIDMYN